MATHAVERRRSAALRAVSGDAAAELRGVNYSAGSGTSPVNSPFLRLVDSDDPAAQRGLADALALVLRHNDGELHRELRPEDPFERLVFDTLEQLRCQALAPELSGVRSNLDYVSEMWCRQARADGVAESGIGLLIYTVTHMVRARLRLGHTDEEVDSIIEGPRAALARLVGHALADLPDARHDQRAFARPAAEIARLVVEMAGDTSGDGGADDNPARFRMRIPAGWIDPELSDIDGEGQAVGLVGDEESDAALSAHGSYHAFTKAFDRTHNGADLYPEVLLSRARADLDAKVRDHAVSPHRLARRLRRIFSAPTDKGWSYSHPEGWIDPQRLPQLVTSIDPRTVFRQPDSVRTNTAAVSLLLDNSGSMKARRFETMAVLADTLSRALDLAGVTNEVLGHTTESWAGGKAMQAWKEAGEPEAPGRVADLSRIIYKDADVSWRRARPSMAAMTITRHFRESIDGEAVMWAHERLLARPEPRRILVVVSDGAPADSGTLLANRQPHYLSKHLAHVVRWIERHSPVEIAAFSIGGAMETVFANSVAVDLDTTLTIRDYSALEHLFT